MAFDVAAAKRLGAQLLYAPPRASEPLTNLGALAGLPAGALVNGATLGEGLVNGAAALQLDGVNDYLESSWSTRTNLITNPSFEVDTTDWVNDVSSATMETWARTAIVGGWSKDGSSFALLVKAKATANGAFVRTWSKASGGAGGYPVTEGQKYTVSAMVNVLALPAKAPKFYIRWINAANGTISDSSGGAATKTGVNELSFTVTAPVGAVACHIMFGHYNQSNTLELGETTEFAIDAVLLEQAEARGEYFPTVAQLESGEAGWSGTAHKSASDLGPFARGTKRTFLGIASRASSAGEDALFGTSGPTTQPSLQLGGGTQNVDFNAATGSGQLTWSNVWPGNAQAAAYALVFDGTSGAARLVINGTELEAKTTAARFAATGTTLRLGVRNGTGAPFVGSELPFAAFCKALTLEQILEVTVPRRLLVQDRPPMRQFLIATSPGGRPYRWSEDEPGAENVLAQLDDEDAVPGGYKELTGSLLRKPGTDYGDMEVGTHLEIFGAGQLQIGEYRLERAPKNVGDYLTFDPAAYGYQGHLADDNSAIGIPIDADMSAWGEPSASRRVSQPTLKFDNAAVQVLPAGDPSGLTVPALSHAWTEINNNGLSNPDVAESWYDGQGIELGKIELDFANIVGLSSGDANWQDQVYASQNGSALNEELTDLNATSTTRKSLAIAAQRFFLLLRDYYAAAFSGTGKWEVQWRNIRVFDRSGIPVSGTWPNVGVLASDVIAYSAGRWAPLLNFTTGPYGTIRPTTFPIPHLTFKTSGTVAAWIASANRFELNEWAVWNKRTLYLNERGKREGRKRWRLRVRPTKLKDAGAQIDRVFNGVLVEFQDVSGTTMIVAPTGSGYRFTDARLLDTDPDNPANKISGERRWTKVAMKGISTLEGAIRTGQKFLEMSKELDGSGSAVVNGYAEDETGALWPYYVIKSGDLAYFVDSSLSGDRYIVNVSRRRKERSAELTFDAPPDGFEAMLEQLDIVLVGLGLGGG